MRKNVPFSDGSRSRRGGEGKKEKNKVQPSISSFQKKWENENKLKGHDRLIVCMCHGKARRCGVCVVDVTKARGSTETRDMWEKVFLGDDMRKHRCHWSCLSLPTPVSRTTRKQYTNDCRECAPLPPFSKDIRKHTKISTKKTRHVQRCKLKKCEKTRPEQNYNTWPFGSSFGDSSRTRFTFVD